MVQYSSLCEGAVVICLGAVDIGDEMLGRVQVECGREEVNDGEKQDKHRKTFTSSTSRQWHQKRSCTLSLKSLPAVSHTQHLVPLRRAQKRTGDLRHVGPHVSAFGQKANQDTVVGVRAARTSDE